MTIRAAINGFGRIGRLVLRIGEERLHKGIEIAAINTSASPKTLAHLFKYDTCFGKFKGEVTAGDDCIIINGRKVKVFSEKDPNNIPWGNLGIDIVIESTGKFTKKEKAVSHLNAGAKKVIITAPATEEDITIVMGVNDQEYDHYKHNVISNASCTTNCLAPFAKVIDENLGIVSGLMTTVHAYTNDQQIMDKSHKDLRRARAAAESIIPTTTGAARAVGKVLPRLKGKLNGFALRVPTPTVSVVDLVVQVEKSTSAEEVNKILKTASEGPLKGILGFSEEPLVSIDFKGDDRSSIIDADSTMVINQRMVKIVAWYDNEWGYSNRTVDLINLVAQKIKESIQLAG